MNDCIFCKIINREIPATIIYEDEDVISFLDIAPVNIGHSLVIPKKHYVNIFETPEKELVAMTKIIKRLAHAIKNALNADGINVTMNNDKAAGQVVFHTHIHIIPRINGDGFGLWHGKRNYNEGEKEEVLKKITSML